MLVIPTEKLANRNTPPLNRDTCWLANGLCLVLSTAESILLSQKSFTTHPPALRVYAPTPNYPIFITSPPHSFISYTLIPPDNINGISTKYVPIGLSYLPSSMYLWYFLSLHRISGCFFSFYYTNLSSLLLILY